MPVLRFFCSECVLFVRISKEVMGELSMDQIFSGRKNLAMGDVLKQFVCL